jgi:hypothetical protein
MFDFAESVRRFRRYWLRAERISAGMAVAAYMGEPGLERQLQVLRAQLSAG